MIRSTPCQFYLKYLVTHPDDYTNEQIRNLIRLQHLDFLGMGHLNEIRRDCVRPTPFYPEDPTHHATQRFLKKEKIYSLYQLDKDVITAIKLLDHPRGKELTESLLVTQAMPTWICSALKRVTFKATPRAINLYKHYYFNTELLDTTELNAVLSMRSHTELRDPDDPDEKRYAISYAGASRNMASRLSAEMSTAPIAQAMQLMRLGYMPSGVEISRIVSLGRMAAAMRSSDCSLIGKSKAALDFGMTAKILSELLESVGDSGDDLQSSLMKMTLQTEAAPIPTLEQITGGQHSVDMIDVEGESVEIESGPS